MSGAYDSFIKVLFSALRNPRKPELPCEDEVSALIDSYNEIVDSEPILLKLSGRFAIIGDLHGNFEILLRILSHTGYPPRISYVFLGDYIDRGSSSLEILVILYALKCMYPTSIYLLRGNHETPVLSHDYGFRQECESRIGPNIYIRFLDSFKRYPMAAILNGVTFCVHGGIGPSLSQIDLDQLNTYEKLFCIDSNPIFVEMLWSDPNRVNNGNFYSFSDRGAGYFYSQDAVESFLGKNNLKRIIRSHECCPNGHEFPFGDISSVITIFSNLDYCGESNDASILFHEENNDFHIKTFQGNNKDKIRHLLPVWLLERNTDPLLELSLMPQPV